MKSNVNASIEEWSIPSKDVMFSEVLMTGNFGDVCRWVLSSFAILLFELLTICFPSFQIDTVVAGMVMWWFTRFPPAKRSQIRSCCSIRSPSCPDWGTRICSCSWEQSLSQSRAS
jgi:hypothetical protein